MKIQDHFQKEGFFLSIRKICDIMKIPRSSVYYRNHKRKPRVLNQDWVIKIYQVIQQYPWYGLDRIHHPLKTQGLGINRKSVHRILKIKGWTLRERPAGQRPRAIDTTNFCTQKNGWCHVTMVVDCCDREIVGWRVSSSGKATIAIAALEDALLKRKPHHLTFRSDNGLVFGSKAFVNLCRKWKVT